MIGADDLADLHDPDEFGVTVQIEVVGQPVRSINCLEGIQDQAGQLRRRDGGEGVIRARPDLLHLRMASSDVPAPWHEAKVTHQGRTWSITDVQPLGRLRQVLTLVPYGDRQARQGENNGRWLPPKP